MCKGKRFVILCLKYISVGKLYNIFVYRAGFGDLNLKKQQQTNK